MSFDQNLYFIAIIPPQGICDEINVFKNDFKNRFNSMAALKVMPHITLKAPFKLSASKHTELCNWFTHLEFSIPAFEIELNNFGAFHNKYHPVVFVNPVMNNSLSLLQKELIQKFEKNFSYVEIHDSERKFKPHIIIAYRDLNPQEFKKAWVEYKNKQYQRLFNINSFHLLKHNGRQWEIIETNFL